MENIALYLHSGSLNHGCEAIVRSTAGILRDVMPQSKINLYSTDPLSDNIFLSDVVDSIHNQNTPRPNCTELKSFKRLKARFFSVFASEKADEMYFYNVYRDAPILDNDIFISVGGDVYCYGKNTSYSILNSCIRERGKLNVLWGCSVGERDLIPGNVKDIKGYDLVIPRESITFENLSKVVDKNKLLLHRDPAFSLNTQFLPLPEGFVEGNTVGINISPLISKYETRETAGMGVASVCDLIEYILEHTSSAVALIPHVMQPGNNDYEFMEKICEKYSHTGRVLIIDARSMNAEQLKGYIARCRFFVGARTHATIAAYSSLVPTLVIGYSVKSEGIARDLFGTEKGLVVPIQNMTDKSELTLAFKDLMKNEEKYRRRLCDVIPSFIGSAKSAGKELLSLV